MGVGFQIGEQPHLLQRVGRQVLSLVNQHHHAQALRIGRKQERIERVDQALGAAALAGDVDAEFFANRFQQLDGILSGVQYQRDARVLGQLFQQRQVGAAVELLQRRLVINTVVDYDEFKHSGQWIVVSGQ